jgi:hypothetical protein
MVTVVGLRAAPLVAPNAAFAVWQNDCALATPIPDGDIEVVMTEASSANFEMSINVPLGVLANQLMRIEADLRLLNMKALRCARERENQRLTGGTEARLDNINETLESIRDLVSDIEDCLQPRSTHVGEPPSKKDASPADSHRKPQAERDD